jgi:hypothetical protein
VAAVSYGLAEIRENDREFGDHIGQQNQNGDAADADQKQGINHGRNDVIF